ncbi:MAG: hypothetical protein NXI31_07995 [bacterium]|nr:hypothetical protein [bacterium]
MQPLRITTVQLALSVAAMAQTNPFVFFPQDPERQTITAASFVGRPDLANAAEALMEIDEAYFQGIGDANGPDRLFGVYHWIADEKLSTVETYDLVIRNGLPTGGPDMSAGAELIRISNLTSPPSPSQQRGTWIMNEGFGLQGGLLVNYVNGPQTTPKYYVGVDLPANPLWPATDGHALFRADLLNANTGATVGENHRAGAPDPTWAGIANGQSFSTPWTYILGPVVTSPNLHIGGVDPTSNRLGAPGANLSMNGLFPDVSNNPRSDGITVRITDNIAPQGLVFLGASLGFQPPVFEWRLQGILIGHSHIGRQPISLDISALNNGEYDYSVALPGTVPTWMIGQSLVFQGIVWDTGITLAEWTNAQVVLF